MVLFFRTIAYYDIIISNKISFLKFKFIMHAPNTLPLLSDDSIQFKDYINNLYQKIYIIRYDFKRLPKPYDTQCYEYSANETQFHCINKCYETEYQNHFKCIPKNNSLLTIRLYDKYIEPNVTFCSQFNLNNIHNFNQRLINLCKHKCPVQCLDSLFLSNVVPIPLHSYRWFEFILNNDYYILIKYSEEFTFIGLIISIANILSLWHGVSFISLLKITSAFISQNIHNVCCNAKIKINFVKIFYTDRQI